MASVANTLKEKNESQFEDSPATVSTSPSASEDLVGNPGDMFAGTGSVAEQGYSTSIGRGNEIYNQNIVSTPGGIKESPFKSDYFEQQLFGFNVGSLDPDTGDRRTSYNPFNNTIDFEKMRSDNQNGF